MSIETLLQAATFLEMQEQQQQASPLNDQHSPISIPAAIPIAAPIRARQDAVVSLCAQPAAATVQIQAATPAAPVVTQRVIRNSFDMINPLVIDEGGEAKRKQPPLVFRSGTREVHNKLEKHRRAHLKECFDALKRGLPGTSEEKKASNLNILHSAIKYIETLTKREMEYGKELEKLGNEKLALQQRLAALKKDVPSGCEIDFAAMLTEASVLETAARPVKTEPMEVVRDGGENDNITNFNTKPMDVQVSINNDLKLTKSITRALPVVTTNSVNGVKEGVLPQTTQVQTTALSVVPIGYQMNQGLVLVPKNIADLSQLASSHPVAHFIATPQQLSGKMVPLVNAQLVMKPLVVVSTPSRPS